MRTKRRPGNFIWYGFGAGVILLSLAAVGRSLIIGLDIDEQYAVTLAYRIASGDILLKEMWEPHQTTAIWPAFFVKLYLSVFGNGEYLVLFLRVLGVFLGAGVSFFWYRVMKQRFDKKVSFLTALIVFHTLPKWIQTPEFANTQIWFLLLTMLCVLQYVQCKKMIYAFGAGLFMVLEVLAYPSCVLLFPFYVVFLWKTAGGKKAKDQKGTIVFTGVCLGCALCFVGYLLCHMSFGEMISYIGYVFADADHSMGILDKLAAYGKEALEILLYVGFYGLIAGVLTCVLRRWKKCPLQKTDLFFALLLLAALLDQIRLWAFGLTPNVHPQIHYLLLFVTGGVLYGKEKEKRQERRILFYLGWISSLIAFAAVMLFTNLDMKASFVHLLPGMLCSFLFWTDKKCTDKKCTDEEAEKKQDSIAWIKVLLLVWVIVLIGARGYLVRATEGWHETVFSVKQKALYSSASGVYCSYMVGYQYNADYLFLHEKVQPEEKMLYIGANGLTYLMDDREVCSASTISTPFYDEKYIEYYKINPEKTPDVIVVDRYFWGAYPDRVEPIKEWILANYDWENKEESEFLWIVRVKK